MDGKPPFLSILTDGQWQVDIAASVKTEFTSEDDTFASCIKKAPLMRGFFRLKNGLLGFTAQRR
jgi:hypothetical protein